MKEKSQEHGAKYWKSLDDLAETPAFKDWVEKEFPSGASELEGVGRRNFMKIMAASFSLAGLGMTGCRRPKQHNVRVLVVNTHMYIASKIELENWIYAREREREREDFCLYLRALRKSTNMTTQSFSTFHCEEEEVEEEDEDPLCRLVS